MNVVLGVGRVLAGAAVDAHKVAAAGNLVGSGIGVWNTVEGVRNGIDSQIDWGSIAASLGAAGLGAFAAVRSLGVANTLEGLGGPLAAVGWVAGSSGIALDVGTTDRLC